MRGWFQELNKGKAVAMAALDELHTADIVRYRGSGEDIHGIENYEQAMSKFFDAYLEIHITIDDIAAEGDKLAVSWTFTGTQSYQ
jgi:predicted ester cyclase